MKKKTIKGVKISDLKKGYFAFGNKGAMWSNSVHIAKNGFHSTTLCGTPMLSSNYAFSKEWCEQYQVTEARCPKCLEIYEKEKENGKES
jgi:hypothetical protein